MIDEHTTGHKAQFMSVTEYAADRARTGFRILPSGPGTFWIGFGFGANLKAWLSCRVGFT